jgi:hypothetical protein
MSTKPIPSLTKARAELMKVGNVVVKFIILSIGTGKLIFQGANSDGESEKQTKRFRIYSFMMENLFSPTAFDRFSYSNKSVYLLRNRKADPTMLATIDDVLKHHGIVF